MNLIPLVSMSVLGILILLAGVRVARGPKLADRVVASDLIGVLFLATTVVSVHHSGEIAYLDVAVALALIAFLGTVIFARFLEKGP